MIGVPEGANADKVASMEALGARVEFHGKDFDEAREWVETAAAAHGYRYIHSANEPLLISGVGTMGLEILEAAPDIDVIMVPVGGGSGACGVAIAAKSIKPDVQVIGIQSVHAPSCTSPGRPASCSRRISARRSPRAWRRVRPLN